MTQTEKLLYAATTHTEGGREGLSRSDDGRLNQICPYSKATRGNIDVALKVAEDSAYAEYSADAATQDSVFSVV